MVSAKFSNIITVLSLYQMFSKATTQQCKSEYSVKGKTLKGFTFNTTKVETPSECFQTCKDNVRCQSFNYVILENICELNNRTKEARPEDLEVDPRRYYFQVKRPPPPKSCVAIQEENSGAANGAYQLKVGSSLFLVYCDMTSYNQGWTLIARFSNTDAANWMKDSGEWWYDKSVAAGRTTDPLSNTDMISPALWLVSGNEIKITRSDDPQHTALLQTTGDCLGGLTFRSKTVSYGNFRNKVVWASNKCLGNCAVQYGGQYQTTEGFGRASCNGEIQSANQTGFWCDWSIGDGAVMMIGGGGSTCGRADHGIGITEANAASFGFQSGASDFGNYPGSNAKSYALNLWIR